MSDTVIKVEDIGKLYRLGEIGTGTLSHDLNRWWAKISRKEDPFAKIGEINDRTTKSKNDYVWALKDINLEIKQGDVWGIIGRNGAGKSTLLKILSKVTTPSKGLIKVKGRIAALLEVGTGFHPELTGRENIFLNGAILGMTKAEIKSKFDAIVDFAGIERYIDTPVKRYSSGMYVRLAFAVSAFLEPEILIVDEVLAVGDSEFQKKCLGRMRDVSKNDGRTILFVSHNIGAVKSLCNKGLVLKNGMQDFVGDVDEAISVYQSFQKKESEFYHTGPLSQAPGNGNIRVLKFYLRPSNGTIFSISSGIQFFLEFYNEKEDINLDATFELQNSEHTILFHHAALITTNKDSRKGIYTVEGSLPPHILNAGIYSFTIFFGENQYYPLYIYRDIVSFEVLNEKQGETLNPRPGVLRPDIEYEINFLKSETVPIN
jgi:lipopolysaccharide transport system ATP-binding protein